MTASPLAVALIEKMAVALWHNDNGKGCPWESANPTRGAAYRDAATAILAALSASLPGLGLKIVPLEATAAMLAAAEAVPMIGIVGGTALFKAIQKHNKRYAAMIAASPDVLGLP